MDVTLILLLAATGALLIPLLGGDDEAEEEGIRGTFEDDELDGTEEDDLIFGWRGDDVINGLGGDDEIRPGEGDDTVDGGEGDDNIKGSPGEDELTGGNGFDTIFGGADNDIIFGGADADFMAGGDGNDVIYGGFGFSGPGGEPIETERNPEFMRGDDGDDRLFSWGDGGEVRGNAGDDELVLLTGEATLEAGGGLNDDFYVLANIDDAQLTEATITDFDPTRDTLTVTIDHLPEAGADLDAEVTLTFVDAADNDGVSGVRVSAAFTNPGDAPDDSEAASAFLVGATLDQLTAADIEVVVTAGTDIDSPLGAENTLAAVKAALTTT